MKFTSILSLAAAFGFAAAAPASNVARASAPNHSGQGILGLHSPEAFLSDPVAL
jgi:hypothetical protein